MSGRKRKNRSKLNKKTSKKKPQQSEKAGGVDEKAERVDDGSSSYEFEGDYEMPDGYVELENKTDMYTTQSQKAVEVIVNRFMAFVVCIKYKGKLLKIPFVKTCDDASLDFLLSKFIPQIVQTAAGKEGLLYSESSFRASKY